LVYLSIFLFPNSYIILFLEFYFFPISVYAQNKGRWCSGSCGEIK
jgi:hypothetical protein